MKRPTPKLGSRAFRGPAALAALAISIFTFTAAHADGLGLVVSASPSGASSNAITMRIPAEATRGTIPLFVHGTGPSTLFSVEFSATPLRDDEGGITQVTPTFDRDKRTIPFDGTMK